MAITGEVYIKVDTAVLVSTADAASKSIRNMKECFEQLETIISRTSHYWIGEAGDLHRKIYQGQKPQIEEMMKRLEEHPADLLTIAGVYVPTEITAESIAESLPNNPIG